jgi:hypothetical protein
MSQSIGLCRDTVVECWLSSGCLLLDKTEELDSETTTVTWVSETVETMKELESETLRQQLVVACRVQRSDKRSIEESIGLSRRAGDVSRELSRFGSLSAGTGV